ncbi:MAG: Uncharacterised protein [Synechococcus sp. MIT S9220]|nr:MAG: Uncharacterised protein [Synechococcus sp. MIT S9220]
MESFSLHFSDRSNSTEAKVPIAPLTIRIDVQTQRHSVLHVPDGKISGLRKGRAQQWNPVSTETKAFRLIEKPLVVTVPWAQALGHGGAMNP